jgi:hypothetical protein
VADVDPLGHAGGTAGRPGSGAGTTVPDQATSTARARVARDQPRSRPVVDLAGDRGRRDDSRVAPPAARRGCGHRRHTGDRSAVGRWASSSAC